MKTILALLVLAAVSAWASNVFVFDPNSSPVAGRGVDYRQSVNTTEYGTSNSIVNPSMPGAFPSLSIIWFKTNGVGGVVAMSTAESNNIVTAQQNAIAASKAFEDGMAKTNLINQLTLMTREMRAIRALAEMTMNQLNVLRTNHLSSTNFPALTLTQLTNALRNTIQSQPDQ